MVKKAFKKGSMFAKMICMGVIIILMFSLTVCWNNYDYKEGDLSLVVTANKTEVAVGDAVEITATLTNLSGRDIKIRLPQPWQKNLEEMLLIGFIHEGGEFVFIIEDADLSTRKVTIKKDASIEYTKVFHITEAINYHAKAIAVFYPREKNAYRVGVSSEIIIIINVKE